MICPDEVTSVSGKAKKARNAREWPSSSTTLRPSLWTPAAVLGLDFVIGFLVLTFCSLPVAQHGSNTRMIDITLHCVVERQIRKGTGLAVTPVVGRIEFLSFRKLSGRADEH